MNLPYDLLLQTAVNQMIVDVCEAHAVALIDLKEATLTHPDTISMDRTTLVDSYFAQNGLYIQLSMELIKPKSFVWIEINYHSIQEIVCYYEDLDSCQTLFLRER